VVAPRVFRGSASTSTPTVSPPPFSYSLAPLAKISLWKVNALFVQSIHNTDTQGKQTSPATGRGERTNAHFSTESVVCYEIGRGLLVSQAGNQFVETELDPATRNGPWQAISKALSCLAEIELKFCVERADGRFIPTRFGVQFPFL